MDSYWVYSLKYSDCNIKQMVIRDNLAVRRFCLWFVIQEKDKSPAFGLRWLRYITVHPRAGIIAVWTPLIEHKSNLRPMTVRVLEETDKAQGGAGRLSVPRISRTQGRATQCCFNAAQRHRRWTALKQHWVNVLWCELLSWRFAGWCLIYRARSELPDFDQGSMPPRGRTNKVVIRVDCGVQLEQWVVRWVYEVPSEVTTCWGYGGSVAEVRGQWLRLEVGEQPHSGDQ